VRPRTLLILLVLVAVVVAGILVIRPQAERADGTAQSIGHKLFPGLADGLNEVTGLTLTSATGTVTVHRDGEQWRVESRDGYPARFETVKRTLVSVSELTLLEAKTGKPELLGKLGLEDPAGADATSALLTLQGAGGAPVASLVVGKSGPGADTTFVRRADENQAWLARGTLAVEREASQWIERDLPKLGSERVKAVTVTHADGATVTVSRETKDDPVWALQDVPEGMQPNSPTVGRTLAGALESLSFDDVRAAAGKPLAGERLAVAVFSTFDGLRLTATSAVEDGKTWATFAATADEGASEPVTEAVTKEVADLDARLSPWVFELPEYRAANLRKHQTDLVQPRPEPPPAEPAVEPEAEPEAEPQPEPQPEPRAEPATETPAPMPETPPAPEEPKPEGGAH